jgi:hypothetical protein
MKPKTPRHFTLERHEWLIQAGDMYSKDIQVLYKGKPIRCTGVIVMGTL